MSAEENLLTVALIDDDEIFQFTALKSIEATRTTHSILQFLNGRDALKYLIEKSSEKELLPDVIFLDINMPLIDGWMFIEEFRKIKTQLSKQITIYMASSSIDQSDISKAKEIAEIAEYVFKPITFEKFSSLLNGLANSSQK